MMTDLPLEQLEIEELFQWLSDHSIPDEFCKILEGRLISVQLYSLHALACIIENLIDGKEFVLLQPEEVMKLIPSLGVAKKIIRLIPQGLKHSVSEHKKNYF